MLQFFSSNVLSVLFVFGTVVIIHEFGHFFVAKLLGIRVDAFAVGFGPRLFGFKRGETDYKVCAIPLGGYVKMAGENPHEDLTGSIEEFLSRPKWQRFLVAVMGPVMNVVLAVLLLAGLYYHKHEVPAWLSEPVIAKIIEKDSPADRAGIMAGDRITAIGEKQDPNWEDFSIEVATSADRALDLEIERDGKRRRLGVTPEPQGRNRSGYLGISPFPASLVRVKEVRKGEPAAAAGILPGDKLVKVGRYDLDKVTKELPEILQLDTDEVVPIVVSRNGQLLELKVRPYLDPHTHRRMIGIGIEADPTQFKMIVKKLTIGQSFQESIKQNAKFATLIFDILRKLVRREVSLRMIEGPIGIARQSGQAAKSGFDDLLFLMAAISLNLGIMNLLPIPVLDGGVIAIIVIETLIRRDLSLNLRERITQVGFAVLILLAVVVTYNDIIKTLPASLEKYFP